jgi:hypothetical protein
VTRLLRSGAGRLTEEGIRHLAQRSQRRDFDLSDRTAKDGKPEAYVNGTAVPVNNVEVSAGAVAECRCNGEILEKAFRVPDRGGIGLQAEAGKFEFRRIRVKELP